MHVAIVSKYVLNCFLLTLPILLWNILLTEKLPHNYQPEVFWKDIPPFLMYAENGSRIAVFMLTLLMPLRISSATQKKGLLLYILGTLLYSASWLVLICYPDSSWSNSLMGFSAPACTPLLWLAGIAFIGRSYYFKWPYKSWHFISISALFLLFHIFHTVNIYFRMH